MSLSLVSGLPLDDLQKMTEKFFSPIIDKGVEKSNYKEEITFDRTTGLGHIFKIIPNESIDKLVVKWPCLSDARPYWRSKPLNYIAHVLSHQGQNSLF
jgi:secreted Zn-dependent insulinase-like peptidase